MITRYREIPRLCREADILTSSISPGAREVDVRWSAGTEVRRFDWWTGETYLEGLSMTPEACKLERLNRGAPVLKDHDRWNQVGKIVEGTARIEGGAGYARLRFSNRPEVDGLWQDIADRIRTKFSVGYDVLQYEEEFTKDGKLFRRTAVLWEPAELSSVSLPADIEAEIIDAPKTRCTFVRSLGGSPSPARDKLLADPAFQARCQKLRVDPREFAASWAQLYPDTPWTPD